MDWEKFFDEAFMDQLAYKPEPTLEEIALLLKQSPINVKNQYDGYEVVDIETPSGKPLRLAMNKSRENKEE